MRCYHMLTHNWARPHIGCNYTEQTYIHNCKHLGIVSDGAGITIWSWFWMQLYTTKQKTPLLTSRGSLCDEAGITILSCAVTQLRESSFWTQLWCAIVHHEEFNPLSWPIVMCKYTSCKIQSSISKGLCRSTCFCFSVMIHSRIQSPRGP
jgi:hypothetical protein